MQNLPATSSTYTTEGGQAKRLGNQQLLAKFPPGILSSVRRPNNRSSSRSITLITMEHCRSSFLPSDVPYKQDRFHQTRQECDQTWRILRASSGVATSYPIARIAAAARSTIWRFVSWPLLPYW